MLDDIIIRRFTYDPENEVSKKECERVVNAAISNEKIEFFGAWYLIVSYQIEPGFPLAMITYELKRTTQ